MYIKVNGNMYIEDLLTEADRKKLGLKPKKVKQESIKEELEKVPLEIKKKPCNKIKKSVTKD